MLAASASAAREGKVFQGELQYDQYYYLASARELFERGNGFAYPNPYDDDPGAPVLYSHLYPLLVGWISHATGLSVLHAGYLVRLLAGAALAISLWRLVGVFLPEARERRAAFWILLLSGGLVWLEALRRLLVGGGPWTIEGIGRTFAESDIQGGWWLQNVFRNFFYGTETVYHALAFRLLYALAAGRDTQACATLLLLLYAHPFTGLQFATITLVWLATERLDGRRGLPLAPLCVSCAGIGAFLLYNLVWLPRFPSHAEIVERWRRVGLYSDPLPFLRVYAPWIFLFLAGIPAAKAPGPARPAWRLLLVAFAVTALLMNHHWILGKERPFQPLHFSHGYLFVPIVLLTLGWALRTRGIGGALRRGPALAALLPLLAIDNVLFLPVAHALAKGMALPAPQARALDRIVAMRPEQTVLSSQRFLSYFLPTFSPHHVILGHRHLTPKLEERQAAIAAAIER
ncbi:MAG: hypothetical protein ACREIU_01260, partial [Planctomycetota bacterium]